jgi:hypothetical protein
MTVADEGCLVGTESIFSELAKRHTNIGILRDIVDKLEARSARILRSSGFGQILCGDMYHGDLERGGETVMQAFRGQLLIAFELLLLRGSDFWSGLGVEDLFRNVFSQVNGCGFQFLTRSHFRLAVWCVLLRSASLNGCWVTTRRKESCSSV